MTKAPERKIIPQQEDRLADEQQAQSALKKLINERTTNFDKGTVVHYAERGFYISKSELPALLAAEREKALREGFLMGFNASGEGWNGEYPYMDNNVSPITDPEWVKMRDEALSALIDILAPAPEALMTAARELIDGASSSYKARNGREVSIEADDGEMCLIVHSDLLQQIEVALEAHETPILAPQPDLSGTSEPQVSPDVTVHQAAMGIADWLRSSLNCAAHPWDSDQRSYAEAELRNLKALIDAETKPSLPS